MKNNLWGEKGEDYTLSLSAKKGGAKENQGGATSTNVSKPLVTNTPVQSRGVANSVITSIPETPATVSPILEPVLRLINSNNTQGASTSSPALAAPPPRAQAKNLKQIPAGTILEDDIDTSRNEENQEETLTGFNQWYEEVDIAEANRRQELDCEVNWPLPEATKTNNKRNMDKRSPQNEKEEKKKKR